MNSDGKLTLPEKPFKVSAEKILNPRDQEKVLETVREFNSYRFTNELDCFPTGAQICDALYKKYRLDPELTRAILYILSSGGRVHPLGGTNSCVRYVRGEKTTFRFLHGKLADSLQKLCLSVYKRFIPLSEISQVLDSHFERGPSRLEKFRENLELFKDMNALDLVMRDGPGWGVTEIARQRESETLKSLQSHGYVPPRDGTAMGPAPRPVSDCPDKKMSDPTRRRAVDSPEWQEFANDHQMGIPWETVIAKFGTEMMIRIILRRQDFLPLLRSIEVGIVNDRKDIEYIRDSLEKIAGHNDVDQSRAEDFKRLRLFLGEWLQSRYDEPVPELKN